MAKIKSVQLPPYEHDLMRQLAAKEERKMQDWLRRKIRKEAAKAGIVSDVK
jgi:adenylate kinase